MAVTCAVAAAARRGPPAGLYGASLPALGSTGSAIRRQRHEGAARRRGVRTTLARMAARNDLRGHVWLDHSLRKAAAVRPRPGALSESQYPRMSLEVSAKSRCVRSAVAGTTMLDLEHQLDSSLRARPLASLWLAGAPLEPGPAARGQCAVRRRRHVQRTLSIDSAARSLLLRCRPRFAARSRDMQRGRDITRPADPLPAAIRIGPLTVTFWHRRS